jgi:hypothetical protein
MSIGKLLLLSLLTYIAVGIFIQGHDTVNAHSKEDAKSLE